MLGSNGKPNGVGFDSRGEQFFAAELGMSCGRRMNHQRFDVRHIGQQGEQLQMVNKPLRLLCAALDFKGEN